MATSEFRVTGVFPVSYQPTPHIVGYVSGTFTVGDPVELRRAGETIAHGVVEWIGFHTSPAGEFSFTLSTRLAGHVQAGDVLHAMDTTEYLIATHGGDSLLESAKHARAGRTVGRELADPEARS
ncbi:hypothetical protein ACFC06_19685 [Nocardia sp. NPDC056064]|uniref:hypothetical protein n=1 Tax=Nocardia sp. NPDC056064 TaxID=3345701 RepID=UPI0035D65442